MYVGARHHSIGKRPRELSSYSGLYRLHRPPVSFRSRIASPASSVVSVGSLQAITLMNRYANRTSPPDVVSVADGKKADELAERLRAKKISPLPAIHHGREGMLTVGTLARAEIVVSAAVGVVGLEATYEAVELGKTVALSNKEVLVAAGELVMAAAKKAGHELLPRR